MEYQPAVVPVDAVGNGKYQEVLPVCRQVAVNRQVTAAQEAQLKTITGVGGGALSGAAAGLQMGSMFKNAGFGASLNKSAGIGAAVGILAGLGDSFSSGTSQGAEETRRILLNCLKASDPEGKYYRVVE
ncbi:hypothetical protein [Pseudoxanthomonas composti]|uniref:Glycine zipper family protein n=1 Tax=Pseudoxanthomonas composti TaxID=2137479 RepID=A0A4Q1K2F6_9GAMM|nr:hypothetical protein [Pseudoxanthomonas composti]RXR08756.1 hypothetical protein EPA99_02785 [Pseudoxanthomonas composti]